MDSTTTEAILRGMAWQRAKGELNSMLETYVPFWKTAMEKEPNGYELAREKIQAFIRDFEDNCQ